jgi:xylulokinase
MAYTPTGGAAMKWFRDTMTAGGTETAGESYAEIDRKATMIPAGSDGVTFLPHFTGTSAPTWRMENRASILGLNLSHTRYAIARAAMEGVAFEIRIILEEMSAKGFAPKKLKMLGGATKSSLWPQITADIVGMPIILSGFPDTPCVGAAILAGIGAGIYKTAEEGYRVFAGNETEVEFDLQNHSFYSELFQEYKRKFGLVNLIYGGK